MKIKSILIAAMAIMLASCSTKDDDAGGNGIDNCLDLGSTQLRLTIQESFTTLPARVSVFFKVNDIDGNPVPGLTASNFRIYEQGRNDDCFNQISSAESSAEISPNAQIFRNSTFLVLDLSNSVLSSSLTELKGASISFINNVVPANPSDAFKMGIYWFDGQDILHQLEAPTASRDELIEAINSIDIDISNDPSTDLYGAVIKSAALAEDTIDAFEQQQIFAAASIVLFTDGTDQAARYTKSEALQSVNSANDNLSFFTIGLGTEIDTDVLSDLGKSGSVFAADSNELEQVFNQISSNVAGQANSFYLFEYCSPKRDGSGINELVIQAFENDRQGAVETQFDATGFTSGCQ